MRPDRAIGVHLWQSHATSRVGAAHVTRRRGTVTTTFDYDPAFLTQAHAWSLGPDLPLEAGIAVTAGLPGPIADGAPDRWGRNLIRKSILALAARDGVTPPMVTDVDYLLGVSDTTRQGALRYTTDPSGPFLSEGHGVPALLELPRLLHAADVVGADQRDDDEFAAVKLLLDAGTGSLGGARPKASVRDGDQLLIAKFPHHADDWDVGAGEKTALDLAERAGIPVPGRRLVDLGGRHVLLLDRFDRNGSARIPYLSGMSLVQATDGDPRDYLELAEALAAHGATVRADLAGLWRRMTFAVAINHTDDHLRNHGFLRGRGGWTLSPVFDITPNPDPAATRATTINFTDRRAEAWPSLEQVAGTFGLNQAEASTIMHQVTAATSTWRTVASGNGIAAGEQDRFAEVLDA